MKIKNATITFLVVIIPLLISILLLAGKMFEYSLWALTAKDIPWFLDILGALVCNVVNLPLWFILYMVVTFCGVHVPIIH